MSTLQEAYQAASQAALGGITAAILIATVLVVAYLAWSLTR